jgi:DNA-binding Lrp family transcriptional regulator
MVGVMPAKVEVMTMAISEHFEGPAGPSAATQFDRAREDSAAAIRAIAQLLEPHREGLRAVTPEGVEEIKKSVLEHGLLPQFPVMRDQHRRILSGRHRLAAAAELQAEGKLDRDWPEEVVRVADDSEAITIAVAANRARPWTAHDFKRLERLGLEWTGTRGKRRMIRLALVENAKRSNRAIARLVGCNHETVQPIREELEASGEIRHFVAKGGTDGRGQGITEGKPATSVLKEPDPEARRQKREHIRQRQKGEAEEHAPLTPAHRTRKEQGPAMLWANAALAISEAHAVGAEAIVADMTLEQREAVREQVHVAIFFLQSMSRAVRKWSDEEMLAFLHEMQARHGGELRKEHVVQHRRGRRGVAPSLNAVIQRFGGWERVCELLNQPYCLGRPRSSSVPEPEEVR